MYDFYIFYLQIHYKQLIFPCTVQFLFETFSSLKSSEIFKMIKLFYSLCVFTQLKLKNCSLAKNVGWHKQCLILSYNTGTCNEQNRLKKEKKREIKLHIVIKSDEPKNKPFLSVLCDSKKEISHLFYMDSAWYA